MGASSGAGIGTLAGATLETLRLADLRSYAALEVDFGPGPHLVWGPNAAGKTSLLEAMVVLARGSSHRTTADAELIRWGADVTRIEARAGTDEIEVALVRPGSAAAATGARKRIRVNGVTRRATALSERLRVVLFAPEDMLLVAGSPSLRRATVDQLASTLVPGYAAELATYGRALQQRNGLLRAIREETAAREELRYWDRPFLDAGGAVVAGRHGLLDRLARPLAAAHREIAPEEGAAGVRSATIASNVASRRARRSSSANPSLAAAVGMSSPMRDIRRRRRGSSSVIGGACPRRASRRRRRGGPPMASRWLAARDRDRRASSS